ncbi:collagenase-like protease [Candidatus Woesearchaeota archaeon CG10_big_fil_rev_8_21_14_0_10_45_16]|nr:MAG: collagenase-like protease [Candidatus Woesearchaeota archaeon CG10_big_fil_rev_8_21_14_0_10_45_16]
MIEIMAPAGSYEALQAAIKAGANSVYFGIEQLNMRARAANNFTVDDLREIVRISRENNLKTYLTLNTVMYDHDITLMKKICDIAKESGLTAVICCDIAALSYARSIGLEVHMSTQTNISNFESVKFYSQFADVIVLARELTIQQIKSIVDQITAENIKGPSGNLVQIEIFVHGALCVAISGKCYMSLATYNSSANRGACLQNCRRAYRVIDEETGDELKVDNKYIMSPKDLCTIGFIDKILDTGVKVLKIEGRGRSPEYVYTVVKTYREAVDSYLAGTYTEDKVRIWIEKLETVFNRGFWHGGYYLGKQLGEWSGVYGSKATKEKSYIGKAENYYNEAKIAQFVLETGEVKVGEEIIITGPTTGVIETTVKSIFVDERGVVSAKKGNLITIPVEEKVRPNDKIFVLEKR